ncbi:hypothetical protein EW093_00755 [Thiospirochaeta perfilievii]|uniref:Uncharacterized protein n=1 Tax=Thiospirochaeta perfilievii TaxID=252967 RepID=A0A5C1Q9H6_9SPIO|nr:hypothetical protein [Thiospirochaeta perfilievii]QEN03294.1 hypothetical protein EW093_00755 [Thiospirochaeta perfilievii]
MSKFNIEDLDSYFPIEIPDLYDFIETLRKKRETLEDMSNFLEETMNIKLIFHEDHNFSLFLEDFFPICQRVIPGREENGEIIGLNINLNGDYHYQLVNPTDISVMWDYEIDITEPLRGIFKNVKMEFMQYRYEEISLDPFINIFLEKPIQYKELIKQ